MVVFLEERDHNISFGARSESTESYFDHCLQFCKNFRYHGRASKFARYRKMGGFCQHIFRLAPFFYTVFAADTQKSMHAGFEYILENALEDVFCWVSLLHYRSGHHKPQYQASPFRHCTHSTGQCQEHLSWQDWVSETRRRSSWHLSCRMFRYLEDDGETRFIGCRCVVRRLLYLSTLGMVSDAPCRETAWPLNFTLHYFTLATTVSCASSQSEDSLS